MITQFRNENNFGKNRLKSQLFMFVLGVDFFQRLLDLNEPTQLLNMTGIDNDIDNHQALKYQPLVTSRLIFQYLMIINGIKL